MASYARHSNQTGGQPGGVATFAAMKLRPPSALGGFLCALAFCFHPQTAGAWGPPHNYISQVAIELLPAWQRPLLQDQAKPFIERYCLYPDYFFAPDAKPYIMPSPPDVKSLLHLPAGLEQNKLVFDYYLPRVVELFQKGDVTNAMKHFGSVTHYLEDSSCPGHMAYGETAVPAGAPTLSQIDFIRRLMPLPDDVDNEFFHYRIDHTPMTLDQLRSSVKGYQPRLLGHSVNELIFNIVEEHHQMNARSARHLIPMLQALGDHDTNKFVTHGLAAADNGTRLLADTLFTVLSIAQNRFAAPPAREVSLADYTPARATPFAWTDPNHQGRLLRNFSGSWFPQGGETGRPGKLPLKLKMPDGEVRTFAKGFGVGWRTEFTWVLPAKLFQSFSVWAGNDAGIGGAGTNTFDVLLDGKVAASSGKLRGLEKSAYRFEIPLGTATNLTLRVQSDGAPNNTHGVWAEPTLIR